MEMFHVISALENYFKCRFELTVNCTKPFGNMKIINIKESNFARFTLAVFNYFHRIMFLKHVKKIE